MEYYPQIPRDLKPAGGARFWAAMTQSDPTIKIDVRKVRWMCPMLNDGQEFNELGVCELSRLP